MKVICTQENLKNALQTVSRIISSSSTLPVLSTVLLKTENGQLKLSATNLEIGINSVTRCKIEKEGEICLHAKTLLELISNLPNQNITIEKEESDVLFSSDNYSTKLKDFPSEEFPSIPEIETSTEFSIDSKTIKSAIDSVIFAASNSESQPEISGMYLKPENNSLVTASTDRYRLAENRIQGKFKSHNSVIVPHRAAVEISRLITGKEGELQVFLSDNQIAIRTDDTEIISRLIDGKYPEYSHIIPKDFKTLVSVLKSDLVTAVKTAGIFSQNTGSIVLEFLAESQEMRISANSHDIGESMVKVSGAVEGGSGSVYLNFRYLLDCLNVISSEHVTVKIIDDSAPVIIQGSDKPDYIYLIMPIKG